MEEVHKIVMCAAEQILPRAICLQLVSQKYAQPGSYIADRNAVCYFISIVSFNSAVEHAGKLMNRKVKYTRGRCAYLV